MMANSLCAKIKKLRHDGLISEAEYEEFIKKMYGHDRELKNQTIDEFSNLLIQNADPDLDVSTGNYNVNFLISKRKIKILAELMKQAN